VIQFSTIQLLSILFVTMKTSTFSTTLCTFSVTALLTAQAFGHGGRRFEIKVIGNQLTAQGYITGGASNDDGGGHVRPYYNAIHDHWRNLGTSAATASLPGFDVLDEADTLQGNSLNWTYTGVYKWTPTDSSGGHNSEEGHTAGDLITLTDPVLVHDGPHGSSDTIPSFLSPLDHSEQVFVTRDSQSVSSRQLADSSVDATFKLVENLNGTNGLDIDFSYDYLSDTPNLPAGTIYVITGKLSTDAHGIADSATVYTIISPDGNGHAERLHIESLQLEGLLGTPVPEPAAASMGLLSFVLLRRRRAA